MGKTYCGFVTIIGRPNVGKSTLLNHMIGEKICITSKKPQTTRDRIMGIKTQDDRQIVFVDTPGIHKNAEKSLNKALNKSARRSISDADLVLFVIEAGQWTEEDEIICELMSKIEQPVLFIINKVDQITAKEELLPFLSSCQNHLPHAEIIPVSAKKEDNLDVLEQKILSLLPESHFYFYPSDKTDKQDTFRISEFIREQVFRRTGQELPYTTAVQIDKQEIKKEVMHIYATIWVERTGQKKIIIGEKGIKLKEIGQHARRNIEKLLGMKVYLNLWIKIKENWSDSHAFLSQLGIKE